MLEWKEAAPLIGVILTAFLGYIGTIVAKGRRANDPTANAAAVPMAIAGALVERGAADGLSLAISQLSAIISAYGDREERWRREDESREREEDVEVRRRHREMVDELGRLVRALEGRR